MKAREWERLATEVVGDYGAFSVRRHVMRSPRTGEPHEFHVLDVPSSVKVIPFTVDGRIVLVEQFRPAVQRLSLELPAGLVENGEDCVTAARRELEEETGWCAGEAELIGEIDPDPSIQTNPVRVVVARGCSLNGERDQDEGEDVAVRVVAAGEIDELIRTGAIRHAATISAWSLYERQAAPGDAAPAE
jgi:ADP-ribose pyrophosphatase